MRTKLTVLLTALLSIAVFGLYPELVFASRQEASAEILPFVKKTESILYLGRTDLNGDGLQDYLLILESPGSQDEGNIRELVILIRQKDHSLRVVKRNTKIVYCSKCGGGWGDPFDPENIITDTKTFSVCNYGGVSLRWSEDFKFNYSKRDRTWQLVEATVSTVDVNHPNREEKKIYRPPKDFGKIDIADFDPGDFLGVGQR